MDAVSRYCYSLKREDFHRIPRPIQKLFYTVAIFCNLHNTGNKESYQRILNYYNKLILSAGIFGRLELAAMLNIKAAQYIPENIKADLKARRIQNLINQYNLDPDSVYFYDDNELVIQKALETGVNSVLVKKGGLHPDLLGTLVRKKEYDSSSVSMVLIDFDKTFAVVKFKKRCQTSNIQRTIDKCLGGRERVSLLYKHIKRLEELGVKIGFITFNTSAVLTRLLVQLEWI